MKDMKVNSFKRNVMEKNFTVDELASIQNRGESSWFNWCKWYR